MHEETGGADSLEPLRPAGLPVPEGFSAALTGKPEVRAAVLGARRSLPLSVRQEADSRLVGAVVCAFSSAVAGGGTVAAYLPFGTEPCATATPTLPQALADAGARVLLPVLLPNLDLDWALYTGPASLAPASRGLWEPLGPRHGLQALDSVAALVVPAVAVDRTGVRLGRGGGSYDRALTRVRDGVPVIAPLYDGELVPALPAEPHDRRVTAVITPSDGLVPL